jgi:hypothetical protein
MDSKLKAISNNVNNNDTIADFTSRAGDNSDVRDSQPSHICEKSVPVLFTSVRGVHLRKFSKSSSANYSIAFCDVERWVSFETIQSENFSN